MYKMRKTIIALSIGMLISCGQQTSEEHIQEAQAFIAQNDNASAIISLKTAVQLSPKSSEARFELGKVYLEEKQFESAEKELGRALEYGYDPSLVLPMLTRAYQRTGAYVAISELDDKNVALSKEDKAEINYFKIVSFVRLNKSDEARAIIADLAQLDTDSVFKALGQAYSNILNKDFPLALQAITKIKDENPDHPEVLKLAAQLHLNLQDPRAAAQEFEHYVTLYPEDLQTTFVLAKLWVDLGETEKAEPYIDTLLAVNSNNGLLNQLKAAARIADKDYPEAQKHAELGIQNGINDPSLRLIAGYAAYQQQDFESAQRHLSLVASSLPDNHPGLRLLAASQLQLGLNTEAGDVLERIEQVNEQDAQLFSKASYELLRQGKVKEAQELVDKSSSISTTAEDLTRLGLLKLSLNNIDGIVNLEEAVEKSPQLESAKKTLATAYVSTKQYDKALELAEQWKVEDADDISAYLLSAEIYSKQKDFDKAKEEFQHAIKLAPEHKGAALGLVNIALAEKDYTQAQSSLNDLLKRYPEYAPALATSYLLSKQQGNTEQGVEVIKRATEKAPNNQEVSMLYARVLLLEQQNDLALHEFSKFDQNETLPPAYWQGKGQALIRSGDITGAQAHYDRWLSIAPNDKQAVVGKLLLLDNSGQYADGVKLSEAFLAVRDDPQMQLLHTHFLLMNNDMEAGKDAYEAIPSELKSMPLVKGFLARLLIVDGKLEEAEPNAHAAYLGLPNGRNLVLWVFTLERLNKKDEAFNAIKAHLKKAPNDGAALMMLAERQISNGDGEAIASYQTLLEKNPNNFVALNNLAYLYLQQNKLEDAVQYAEKAIKQRPNNVAAVDTYAQVLVAKKEYKKAVQQYDAVVNDDMQNEEIYLNYVEALFLDGSNLLAKRKLERREMKIEENIQRQAQLKAKYAD
jgi:putative PEP-CTERM system TPR-repeat lipoprotein